MLVLTRGEGQAIHIGNAGDVLDGPIVIDVVEIRGRARKVRLGIKADKHIDIFRGEIEVEPSEESVVR